MRPPHKPNRPFWSDYWRGVHAMPRAWAVKGENLFHAFEAVASASVPNPTNFDCMNQAFMLAGMAIETMLKAILLNDPHVRSVVTAPQEMQLGQRKTVRKVFFSHNLRELANMAKLSLTEVQIDTMDVLTTYIIWRGRYVVPMERDIDDLFPIVGRDGLVHVPHVIPIEEVQTLLGFIIAEVKGHLYNAP